MATHDGALTLRVARVNALCTQLVQHVLNRDEDVPIDASEYGDTVRLTCPSAGVYTIELRNAMPAACIVFAPRTLARLLDAYMADAGAQAATAACTATIDFSSQRLSVTVPAADGPPRAGAAHGAATASAAYGGARRSLGRRVVHASKAASWTALAYACWHVGLTMVLPLLE
jgi:hypothetical protein